jgi:type I restriction enzyme S subunit
MITKLNPYPKLKDSGMLWLGQVPEHWKIRPTFGVFVPIHDRNHGMKEKTVLSLSYGRIVIKPVEKLHGLVPESFETYQIVNSGDIILRTTDLQNDHTSLRVGMVRNRGIITSAYLALRTAFGVSTDFGFQFLNVWDTSKAIYGYGSGLRQNLNFSHFKRMPVAVPPPAEQAAIVRFLDWANGRLERVIRAKRKVITLLNEQKQAIIHRAVTRGLDLEVPLKPSGIPWLGDIPQHWEVLPLKRIAWFKGGAGFPVEEQGKEALEIPFLKVSDMTKAGNERWIDSENNSVSRETARRLGAYVFPENSIIFPKVGGAMLTNKRRLLRRPCCIDNNVMGCVLHRGDLEFVFVMLEQLDLGRLSKPGPVPAISEGEVREIRVTVPPVGEQQAIVRFLREGTQGLLAAISRLEREIELLREYRTRLVSDVVTGKLDVREAASKLPPTPDDVAAVDEGKPTDEASLAPDEEEVRDSLSEEKE